MTKLKTSLLGKQLDHIETTGEGFYTLKTPNEIHPANKRRKYGPVKIKVRLVYIFDPKTGQVIKAQNVTSGGLG